jgi:maltooligosyltrehalose trehalohydrolase
VILDVVYNHFGVSENWTGEFADGYSTDRYKSEWSDAINFDGDHCEHVREFFITNARYWIEEFHLDGFRFDATQAIHDCSSRHILTDITTAARQAAGRKSLYLVAENEAQDVRSVQLAEKNGHGMDAMWNDDFHHAGRVRLTDHNPAYYSDYLGSMEELIAAVKRGFIYQGQRSQWQEKPRGTPTSGLPATAFVSFLQNHDQVANSATGERLDRLTSPGRLRAMTGLWLLAPQTPLFFQGQEFAATSPFLFFADFKGDLSAGVSQGRAKFLSQFPNLETPEAQRQLPNPTDPATFERCKLDLNERQAHRHIYDLHTDLLRLRREDAVFAAQRADRLDGAALGPDCLLLRYFGEDGDDRLLLVNFGRDLLLSPAPQPLLAPPNDRHWIVLWNSEDFRYGGTGSVPIETDDGWHICGESTAVLKASLTKLI